MSILTADESVQAAPVVEDPKGKNGKGAKGKSRSPSAKKKGESPKAKSKSPKGKAKGKSAANEPAPQSGNNLILNY